MAKINAVAQAAVAEPQKPAAKLWQVIGKAWLNKGMVSVAIGRKTTVNGQLVDTFKDIQLNAGDRLVLRPNRNKREGVRDADYDVCLPE